MMRELHCLWLLWAQLCRLCEPLLCGCDGSVTAHEWQARANQLHTWCATGGNNPPSHCPPSSHAADAPVLMAQVAALKASLYGASANGYLKERLNAQGVHGCCLLALMGLHSGMCAGGQPTPHSLLSSVAWAACHAPPTPLPRLPLVQALRQPTPQYGMQISARPTLCLRSFRLAMPRPLPPAAPAMLARLPALPWARQRHWLLQQVRLLVVLCSGGRPAHCCVVHACRYDQV